MNIQSEVISIQSRFGITTHNTLLKQVADSDKLLIMLPGWAYTCDFPMLYYLRNVALQQGYDVFSVEYGFQAAHSAFDLSQSSILLEDVRDTVQPILARQYKHVCLAGKSLGTPLAADLAHSITNALVSLILLTPIGGSTQGLGNIRTLVVMGTADPNYSADEVSTSEGHTNIKWSVFENLNHSLEVTDNWRKSADVLPEIMEVCAAFLGETQ